jgi:hypothetical protein
MGGKKVAELPIFPILIGAGLAWGIAAYRTATSLGPEERDTDRPQTLGELAEDLFSRIPVVPGRPPEASEESLVSTPPVFGDPITYKPYEPERDLPGETIVHPESGEEVKR